MILIQGPSGSGKSLLAERLAVAAPGGRRLYLATMQPHGDEGRQRVSRHRRQRAGKGFLTREIACGLDQLEIRPDDVVLLEDVSNLLANWIFTRQAGEPVQTALAEILALRERCAELILVTIGGLTAKAEYDASTNAYIEALNDLNSRLAEASDQVLSPDHPVFGAERPETGLKGGA